jgi:putative addiction module component (TIGR02574 family)
MTPTLHDLGIDRMSTEDRLRLIGEIWDSFSGADQSEIPESHRAELDHRLAAADADPAAGPPWEEVRARLRGGKVSDARWVNNVDSRASLSTSFSTRSRTIHHDDRRQLPAGDRTYPRP